MLKRARPLTLPPLYPFSCSLLRTLIAPPGAAHEIALVAEPTQQARASVWKRLFPSAPARVHSCPISHDAQPLVSHAPALPSYPLKNEGF
jgi:hypothetical protein